MSGVNRLSVLLIFFLARHPGRLHDQFENTSQLIALDDFAAQHYNQAIREHLGSLTESSGKSNIDSYLISCMVFMAMEMILG